jgi:hypothetical protein
MPAKCFTDRFLAKQLQHPAGLILQIDFQIAVFRMFWREFCERWLQPGN